MSMLTTALVIPFIRVKGVETLSMSVLQLVKLFKMFLACLMKLNHQGRNEVVSSLLSSPEKENCYFYPHKQFHLQESANGGEGVEA